MRKGTKAFVLEEMVEDEGDNDWRRFVVDNTGRELPPALVRAGRKEEMQTFAEMGVYAIETRSVAISKGANITKAIAVQAVAAWRQILIALPDVLAYASLSKFLDKFEKKPIFFPGDRVSVRWYADGQQYEGILTKFESDGWCWVEFFGEEGAWIVRQDLNPTTVVQL